MVGANVYGLADVSEMRHSVMAKRIGMSARQYAAHVGVTPQAIDKARKAGRLVLHPEDGSIDAAASDHRRAQETDPAQQGGRRHAAAQPAPAAVGAVNETSREQGLPGGEPTTAGAISFADARRAHEVLKAQLKRLELQKKRGELVDRTRATALVFRLARQERDAWLSWLARVAAIIAAELGCGAHAVQTVLEKHVREHLLMLSEIKPDFR